MLGRKFVQKERKKNYVTAIYIYPELNYRSDVILIQRKEDVKEWGELH